MEPAPTVDSAFTSFRESTISRGTMSSFSIGSSLHHEDWKASTSGCSSSIAASRDTRRRMVKKKERVKRCLKELKSLVRHQNMGGETGTLSALQHVLHEMKRMKEVQAEDAAMDTELIGALSSEQTHEPQSSEEDKQQSKDWYQIVTSAKESSVLQVSAALLEMLGYPKNYWFNQPLLDYVYKRDVVTVGSNLSSSRSWSKPTPQPHEDESSEGEQKNIFFFRLRHYKSIRQGFSLNQPEKYKVFCGRVSVRKVELNFPPGTPVEGLQADKKYAILECTPIDSAYTDEKTIPDQHFFMTRHTIHCNYNFVHPSSIPLTGYLPQDMIGTSIFDYYHPNDLSILMRIHQQVVSMPGKTFRSVPYSLRVKNGDYITVETEWSSFVNPWTNRLDFIIGQHSVIQGPKNPAVFAKPPNGKDRSITVTPAARALQKRIRYMLLQVVQEPKPVQFLPMPPVELATPALAQMGCGLPQMMPPAPPLVGLQEESLEQLPEGNELDKASKTDDLPRNDVQPCSGRLDLINTENGHIYTQLNYAQNIRRFLLSCALSSRAHSSSNEESSHREESSDDAEELEVDLNLPKPPSFASSTKALVSEREQLEEVLPLSPTHEDVCAETENEGHSEDDVYQPVMLTEEVLELHNQMQQQSYIQKMVKEKASCMTPTGRGIKVICSTSSHGHKRHIQEPEDSATLAQSKVYRQAEVTFSGNRQQEVSLLQAGKVQSTALPKLIGFTPSAIASSTVPSQSQNSVTMPSTSGALVDNSPGMAPRSEYYQAPLHLRRRRQVVGPRMRTLHVVSNNPQGTMGMSSLQARQMQWPHYQHHNGLSGCHQIMYQSMPSYFRPISAHPAIRGPLAITNTTTFVSTSESSSVPTNSYQESYEQKTGKIEDSNRRDKSKGSEDNQSLEETSSSLLYLLESGSQNNSNSDLDEFPLRKVKHVGLMRPWLSEIDWNENVQMRQKMPVPEMKKVLKADRLALSQMKQPSMVMDQCQELLDLTDDIASHFVMDEEGFLTVFETEAEEKATETTGHLLESSLEQARGNDKDLKVQEKIGCDSDSSEGNVSKDSSELTPSDQRSHDEAVSSIKEWDNVLSSDNNNDAPASHGDTQRTLPAEKDSLQRGRHLVERVFLELKLECPYRVASQPAWLLNTDFNADVQMKYQNTSSNVSEILEQDQMRMATVVQPDAVKAQFTELVAEFTKQVTQALTPVCPSESGSSFKSYDSGENWEEGGSSSKEAGRSQSSDSIGALSPRKSPGLSSDAEKSDDMETTTSLSEIKISNMDKVCVPKDDAVADDYKEESNMSDFNKQEDPVGMTPTVKPDAVKPPLNELVAELKKQVTQALTPVVESEPAMSKGEISKRKQGSSPQDVVGSSDEKEECDLCDLTTTPTLSI